MRFPFDHLLISSIFSFLYNELNDNLVTKLGGLSFGVTSDGQAGYRKPGADTVTPFPVINNLSEIAFTGSGGAVVTVTLAFEPKHLLLYWYVENSTVMRLTMYDIKKKEFVWNPAKSTVSINGKNVGIKSLTNSASQHHLYYL